MQSIKISDLLWLLLEHPGENMDVACVFWLPQMGHSFDIYWTDPELIKANLC
jgi:hypothetical protein